MVPVPIRDWSEAITNSMAQALSLLLAAAATFAVSRPALADIYTFKDANGVVHFTNIPNGDKRYKLVRKEESTSDYARAAAATGVWRA